MISTCFSPQYRPARVIAALAGLTLAVSLALFATAAKASNLPPTDGEMQGFTLLKQRVAAPTVPFQTGEGGEIDMTAFQGKVLIVNFWATWCAPCIKEMPSLDKLQAAFPDEDFEVVAINQDRGGKRVAEPFLRDKLGLENLDIYLDAKFALGRAFKNRGLPATYAIDRQGNIVGGMFGPAEWDSEDAKKLVRHLLDEKAGG
ncbi:TlpA family protein disulfide reductase [Hwanghaeella grinnelliae]|uniref:TlpA family protein disulfide reductase n=1 Tax=Hwanghaeella grinnelliae TaxID=2500179 RepID=A0A3S2WS82_9PROT|nr:TlpA disulfide reductase family protein [Hwanghaeella grinnelliae]RVU36620.1 TlpA family protein disulfide reductase [Hwanghaeella grinnelliae]